MNSSSMISRMILIAYLKIRFKIITITTTIIYIKEDV